MADPAMRTAIVLFNLGGPDSLDAVPPFLLNLFRDPAILRVPFFVRPVLARVIARARIKPATENYRILGGRSPLLELTTRQAGALEASLSDLGDVKCFVAMRYWHPFAAETVRAVKEWAPDRLLLLPLYPQFSTTTTGSSLTDWRETAAKAGLVVATTTLCCWQNDAGFIAATAAIVDRNLRQLRAELGASAPIRLLFSAHGLPEVIVRRGDPYQLQVERTAEALVAALRSMPGGIDAALDDTIVCYQSRATPQRWLEPSTDTEIERAGHEGVSVLIIPLAFVSEHSETLVELDVEYRELAQRAGVPAYRRVPTQNDDASFIDAMADLAREALQRGPGLCSHTGRSVCPRQFGNCPLSHERDTPSLAAAA